MSDFICPECGSNKLLVIAETAYYLNSGDYFCKSVKTFDDIAKVKCISCEWKGKRADFNSGEVNDDSAST